MEGSELLGNEFSLKSATSIHMWRLMVVSMMPLPTFERFLVVMASVQKLAEDSMSGSKEVGGPQEQC